MKIGLVQFEVTDSVEENINTVTDYINSESWNENDLVALPESFFYIGKEKDVTLEIAENVGTGYIQDSLKSLAIKNRVNILAGTVPILNDKEKGMIYACSMLYDSRGKVVATYNKMNLFDVTLDNGAQYHESKYYSRGEDIVVGELNGSKIGMSVCYDIRFPEMYLEHVNKGADIIAIPSAFTHDTGKSHWHVLAQARAIENFSYVIAPNQMGTQPNGNETYGHSLIVSPWGEVILDMGTEEGVKCLDIDLDLVKAARAQIPSLQSRLDKFTKKI